MIENRFGIQKFIFFFIENYSIERIFISNKVKFFIYIIFRFLRNKITLYIKKNKITNF